MHLDSGDVLAIIGTSGSGKTTLSRLIIGALKPTLGSVRIDSAETYTWNTQDRNQYMGYVPQDIELFGGTIRENIARMDPNATDESVVEAAEFTKAHEIVLRMPKGYDTEIGYAGSLLSGGQKQRIALARAFYGDPKFVVLDEPNSNLDAQGEADLSEVILKAKERKITTVIISHRTSIMSVVDKIMVMRDGTVVSFGPKDEVLRQLNNMGKSPTPGVPQGGFPQGSSAQGQTQQPSNTQFKLSTKNNKK